MNLDDGLWPRIWKTKQQVFGWNFGAPDSTATPFVSLSPQSGAAHSRDPAQRARKWLTLGGSNLFLIGRSAMAFMSLNSVARLHISRHQHSNGFPFFSKLDHFNTLLPSASFLSMSCCWRTHIDEHSNWRLIQRKLIFKSDIFSLSAQSTFVSI